MTKLRQLFKLKYLGNNTFWTAPKSCLGRLKNNAIPETPNIKNVPKSFASGEWALTGVSIARVEKYLQNKRCLDAIVGISCWQWTGY